MKMKTTNNNIEIEKRDEELEKLANHFIATAERKGINKTTACKLLSDVWKEKESARKAAELQEELKEETEEEKTFREKAKKFLEKYDEVIFENIRNENVKQYYKSISLDIICLSYRMFLEEDQIIYQNLIPFIKKRLHNVTTGRTSLNYTIKKILDELYYMLFSRFSYKVEPGSYPYHLTSTKEIPIYSKEITSKYDLKSSRLIFEHEEFLSKYEYPRNSKASVIILEIVWVIQTFF